MSPRTRRLRERTEKTLDSRLRRIQGEQVVHDIHFEMEATSCYKNFEKTISAVFGVPGIGKSKFAAVLGEILQRRYSLKTSGTYFLQCEPINHPWEIRASCLDTWPTFRNFVDDAEADPDFVKTVKMWVIDTIDGTVELCAHEVAAVIDDFQRFVLQSGQFFGGVGQGFSLSGVECDVPVSAPDGLIYVSA